MAYRRNHFFEHERDAIDNPLRSSDSGAHVRGPSGSLFPSPRSVAVQPGRQCCRRSFHAIPASSLGGIEGRVGVAKKCLGVDQP